MLGRLKIFIILALFCPHLVFAATDSVSEFNNFFDLITKLNWENSKNDEEREMFEKAAELKKQLDCSN